MYALAPTIAQVHPPALQRGPNLESGFRAFARALKPRASILRVARRKSRKPNSVWSTLEDWWVSTVLHRERRTGGGLPTDNRSLTTSPSGPITFETCYMWGAPHIYTAANQESPLAVACPEIILGVVSRYRKVASRPGNKTAPLR